MAVRSKKSQDHNRHCLQPCVNRVFREKVSTEQDFQRMAVRHVGEPKGGDGDIEIERIDLAEYTLGNAAFNYVGYLSQDRPVEARDIGRRPQMHGTVQVLGIDHADEGGVLDVVAKRELYEAAYSADGIVRVEFQLILGIADASIEVLHRRNVEVLLAAEVVIDHRLVGTRPLGDAVDPGAADSVGGEFKDRRVQQRLPTTFRRARL